MPVNPGGSLNNADGAADNEGPHCRNCHIGASSCQSCHGINNDQPAWFFGADATYSLYTSTRAAMPGDNMGGYEIPATGPGGSSDSIMSGKLTSYMTQQYVHTNAAVGINSQCIDGGFSYPHRTLGKDLLKDELYGIDFDGTEVLPGDIRGTDASDQNVTSVLDSSLLYSTTLTGYNTDTSEDSTTSVYNNAVGSTPLDSGLAAAENLDTVCLDCHGGATSWNGDNTAYAKTYTNANGANQIGWDMLLKGLP